MGLYEDKRPLVKLSEHCWDCLHAIQDVEYANVYTFFWSEQLKLVQQGIRKIAPDIKGDWVRFKFEGKTVTFSLSDKAIISYKPKIQGFSSFGSAVRMLGAYEDYVRKIAGLSNALLSSDMKIFKNNHKNTITKNTNSYVKSGVGRGIDFFQELFKYKPHSSYRPGLEFFYQFRNVSVHNSGIVDERLLDAANNPFISIMGGTLQAGMKVEWNLSLVLQLHHLLTDMLPQVDQLVSLRLGLIQSQKRAWWYLDNDS